jgi:hypothetical protein
MKERYTKFTTTIRIIFSIIILALVFNETGIFTTVALLMVMLGIELHGIVLNDHTKYLRKLIGLGGQNE